MKYPNKTSTLATYDITTTPKSSLKCPKCKTHDLKVNMLEDGLMAVSCNQCGGIIIPMIYYRHWATCTDNQPEKPIEILNIELIEKSETRSAITCPKCGRLMTKHHISSAANNRLDWCKSCDEVWLDKGEWDLLKKLSLSKKLAHILTDAWQAMVRKEIRENNFKERFTKLVGKNDIDKANEIRTWLLRHKKRAELLHYIARL